jgi:hypothetical protein
MRLSPGVFRNATLSFVLFACAAFPQAYRGRVQGNVNDPTEAAIGGATVTLTNTGTGISVVRQSGENGHYLFDLVDPGTYTVSVEMTGFSKFIQENILVQTRGDVTVNAVLKPGSVQESVTVTEAPPAVQFNSASRDFTLDSKLVAEIPRNDRNPFKLTLLAPSAVNTRGEMQPYHSWAANSVDLGGGTNLKNDLQIDGSPIGLGHKNSYVPNTDAVQEVVVATNSVDAESGHSAGGSIVMTLKSGTNDWHGTGFYLGRYPWLNAEADRTRFSSNAIRQHMFGGTIGNPIIKNKLFNFFSLEYWKIGQPQSFTTTVPTALERQGDFSQTYNIDGGIKTVYDPFSSVFNPATGVTRTPFAGNRIPSSRFDPVAQSLLGSFWDPNSNGDNITHANNFKQGFTETFNYYNFSDRVDYNLNDKWKFYGRFSKYHTTNINPNPTPNNSPLYVPTGTLRAGNQAGGDAVWSVSPQTVVNFHGSWQTLIDSYVSDSQGEQAWQQLWPNNPWYKNYLDNSPGVPIYFPQLTIGGVGYGGRGFYWDQRPKGQDYSAKVSHQKGSHFLKAGVDYRRRYGVTFVGNTSNFLFPTELTAETSTSPNTRLNGFGFATFLLGGLDQQSQMVGGPAPDPHNQFWGLYFQDDWKITRWLTLNLGLRYEWEPAWYDPGHNLSRGLDLSTEIPEMQANPPNMPAQALALVGPNYHQWNGQWQFTSEQTPGMWGTPLNTFAPRLGAAIRVTDKTAVRVGYARYVTPTEMNLNQAPVSGFETVSFLEPPYFGIKGYQNTLPLIEGRPQQTISNPYPNSINPLLPIQGRNAGTTVGRGGAPLLWYPQTMKKQYNDRFNFNIQQQLPGELVASFTYFLNLGNQHYTRALNNINPQIQLAQQNALNEQVDNPFYNYLTPELFPGPLRNQQKVSLGSLLTPYPHYGGLYEVGTLGARERYHSFEAKLQKSFSKGWNFLGAYVYVREKTQQFFNEEDTFLNRLTYINSNQPRHRLTMAGSYELPFGKGRPYMSNANGFVDAILGGWRLTGISTYSSGAILRFNKMNWNGEDPTVANPTPERWFNTDAFSVIPGNTFVLRSNPIQFDNLTGPNYYALDATLVKRFNFTERIGAELKMAAYNAINRLNRGMPNTDITSSQFGQALYQGSPAATFGPQTQELANVSGRQVEIGMKIIF